MGKAKFSLVKKATFTKHATAKPKDATGDAFQIVDNGDGTFSIFGVDAAGNGGIDISSLATLAVSSDNLSVLTVDPPTGMGSTMHAVGSLGSANVVATVTFNDGSIGPFSATLAVTVVKGAATGVQIVIGTVTTH